MKKVIVTGASGVLGTAVYNAFKAAGDQVVGLAHSRPASHLTKLDLCDFGETSRVFQEYRPDWVVHCAAERRPDVAEKDPDAARKLNVAVTLHLAELGKSLKYTLVYISTDYVFDGTSPPYLPSSITHPVNLYGTTKRDGELAVLGVEGSKSTVLRVPVLYGPAPRNTDSAVNVLLDVVQDQSGKQYKMDHYATRYPTNVLDIAQFLVRLSHSSRSIPPVLHYSAPEPYTKYEMCLVFAKILKVPIKHVIPDAEAPQGDAATSRPRDCQLYTKETEVLMEGNGGLGSNGFEEWWSEWLTKKN